MRTRLLGKYSKEIDEQKNEIEKAFEAKRLAHNDAGEWYKRAKWG